MNYHIMTYGATTESFIEDVYSLKEQDNNLFIILETGEVKGFKRSVIYKKPCDIENYLQTLKTNDNIFIHYYHIFLGNILLKSPNKLYVFQWGGDFFEDPINYHKNRLYDKKTLKLYNEVLFPYHKVRNPINYFKLFYKSTLLKKKAKKDFLIKSKHIERIDFVINSKENTGDIEKTKELYPKFKAKHLPGSYDASFEFLDYTLNHYNGEFVNILLGNSATYANNHLDAFEILKKYKKQNIKIYVPLTYGNDAYKKEIIRKGRELFKENFIPIINHMQKEDYIKFLKKMNVGLFFHKRSQAFGNMLLLLSLGIPIFLNTENTLKTYFDNISIKTYHISKLLKLNLLDVINESNIEIENTLKIIKTNISDNRRLRELKSLLNR